MPHIRVSTLIDAPRHQVWEELRDIGSHVRWMQDAEAIRITSPHRAGVGTTFECKTRLGPLRLKDRMEVTEWRERRAMGIRHSGLVKGRGRFTLRRRRGGTLFTWDERLRFPWWLGGRLVGMVAAFVLRRTWRANLARFKSLTEVSEKADPSGDPAALFLRGRRPPR